MPEVNIECMAGAKMNNFIVAFRSQHIGQFIQGYYFFSYQYLLWLAVKRDVENAVVFVFFKAPLIEVISQIFACAAVAVYVIDIAVAFQKLKHLQYGVLFFQIFTPVALQAKHFFNIGLGKFHLYEGIEYCHT